MAASNSVITIGSAHTITVDGENVCIDGVPHGEANPAGQPLHVTVIVQGDVGGPIRMSGPNGRVEVQGNVNGSVTANMVQVDGNIHGSVAAQMMMRRS